jgi:Na+-transporting NADH:ubiquinone oxidoreductase subunit C
MKERLYVIFFVVVLGIVAAAAVLTVANSILHPMYEMNVEREAKGNVLIALGITGWDKARVKAATMDEIKETFAKYIIAVDEGKALAPGEELPPGEEPDFYEGYRLNEDGSQGELIGYAFKITGPGFWDRISGYLAVDPDVAEVIGITFYEDSETPGLGHKINDPEWQRTWLGKPIYKPGTETPWIGITPAGRDKPPNEVDAISGATETSGALQKFMNAQMTVFVDKVKAYKAAQ